MNNSEFNQTQYTPRKINNTIETIWTEQTEKALLSIVENPKEYSREELLTQMFDNYSGEVYWNRQWKKTNWGWTPINTIYGDFRESFDTLWQLSLDAWFIAHLPECIDIIKETLQKNPTINYKELRNILKKELGYQEVWRGMLLTDDEVENIRKNGIGSTFVNRADIMKQEWNILEQFEHRVIAEPIDHLYEKHFHGENPFFSPFISVSTHKDIAIAVGRHFGRRRENEEKKFYLFKIKLPKIDLIHTTEHWIRKPSILDRLASNLSISVDNKENEYPWDKDAESYVFWKINPEEILEISQPEVKETSRNNQKTIGSL